MPLVHNDLGILLDPLDLFEQVLSADAEWLAWGTNRAIYKNEERIFFEDVAVAGWMANVPILPMVVIWLEDVQVGMARNQCEVRHSLNCLFQNRATSRDDHQTSHAEFAEPVGKIVYSISRSMEETHDTYRYSTAQMIFPVMRVREEIDIHNDIWSCTWQFQMRELG